MNRRAVFIFLAAHNFWEGLFDNSNIKFILNILPFQFTNFPRILMSIIVPHPISDEKKAILKEKEDRLRKIAWEHGTVIEFLHIRGRTIQGLYRAYMKLYHVTSVYDRRFIWASNYFNCFLGSLLKQRVSNTRLHFEMLGLTPEEERFHSGSNSISGMVKFLTLRLLCRVNIKAADSISVVSKRFKNYVISRYHINPSMVDTIPCFYDDKIFYADDELRKKFRKKYLIQDHQKLVLYSGMLQKWQSPESLFAFFKNIQQQDTRDEFRLMVATFDRDRAANFAEAFGISGLIIDSGSGYELNGIYNAADIGVASRSEGWVSRVSSPVKIPEYLATQNSIILLEYIGDYGLELKNKSFACVKRNSRDLIQTNLSELQSLKKPGKTDLEDVLKNYSVQTYLPVINKIFDQSHR